MAVRIIADSSSDAELIDDSRLVVLPLTVMFGEESYYDRVNLSSEEFYNKLETCKDMPVTSRVNPFFYEEAYKKVLDEGDEIVVICLASTVSGTYESAKLAAQNVGGEIYVVDSRQISLGTNIQVHYALDLADRGLSAKEIAEELDRSKGKTQLFAAIDTLEYLRRSGRISQISATLGEKLSIKPVVTLVDGTPIVLDKAHGTKAALRAFAKEIKAIGEIDYTKPTCFAYTGNSDAKLRQFLDDHKELWEGHIPQDDLNITLAGPTIGTHVGPDAIGIAFFTK